MNEVTRIHLGRQPFTIAVDAHKALKAYLADIKAEVGDKSTEVIKEVELRMAELLVERGISGDKTILMDDVSFLEQQLGDPQDFKDDDQTTERVATQGSPTKRLFRDTNNGMVAGVAAGLASYFGLDVLLVRIVFIITILAGGWGLLLYIALWILVPEAKSSSERLQMQGKAVTVDSLKDVVERADIHGAAHRAGSTVGPWINSVFRLILKLSGIVIILIALSVIFALVVLGIYMAVHDGRLFQEGFFPVGTSEHLLVILGLFWAGLASLFGVLIGLAMVRRKWPIAGWATGAIFGLLFVCLAVIIALAGDTVPKVHQRFEAAHHSVTRGVPAFTSVDIMGDRFVDIQHGSSYAVTARYIGNPDVSKIKTSVVGGKLTVDTRQFTERSDCDMLCIFHDYDLVVTVYSPGLPTVTSSDRSFDTRFKAPPYPVVIPD